MDDVIFEEFKGTGNMEVHLDRNLSERRIFPAIDINKSGTRREDLLLSNDEYLSVMALRKSMSRMNNMDMAEKVMSLIANTKNNTATLYEDNIGLRAIVEITDADVIEKAKNKKLRGLVFWFYL